MDGSDDSETEKNLEHLEENVKQINDKCFQSKNLVDYSIATSNDTSGNFGKIKKFHNNL